MDQYSAKLAIPYMCCGYIWGMFKIVLFGGFVEGVIMIYYYFMRATIYFRKKNSGMHASPIRYKQNKYSIPFLVDMMVSIDIASFQYP